MPSNFQGSALSSRDLQQEGVQRTPPLDGFKSLIVAVHARAEWAKAEIFAPEGADPCTHPGFDYARELVGIAADLAADARPVPSVLQDVPWLAIDYWSAIQARREAESEVDRINERLALARRDDWPALGFPTPEDLCAVLQTGSMVFVADHGLQYTRSLAVTWYTNPYGVDGILCGEPTVERIRSFLTHMVRGDTYGAVPA